MALAICAASLGACQMTSHARQEKAHDIAQAARMTRIDIAAQPFLIRAYERFGNPAGGTMRVYIEGDGLAWLDKSRPSPDPTPINPLGLALAQLDGSANVVYLARPCQYNPGLLNGAPCPSRYWRSARFSADIAAGMNAAIDTVKNRHGIQNIELVGYSGGAAIAVLVAAKRDDILSIRTIAGNLDSDLFARLHGVSPLASSLNPAGVAQKTAGIPQIHFVGAEDDIIPREIYDSFLNKSHADSGCLQMELINNASHENGWTDLWPALLEKKPVCQHVFGR